jgi:hypothetical protein
MEYTDMTDEEYDALDKELTRTVPKLGPNGTGFLSQLEMYRLGFTNMTVNYIMTKAEANHKSPIQIVNEIVSEKIAAAAST